ncbi:acetyltransferase [Lactococcus formosensis]|uniref:acetyltransferase n=1 Tax=Lactococcus formosensis TaxID=1281486 RepID=UPI002435E2BE|nr:acetyltransferase [Lactococcus formosensis]MDG6126095.1 acetyltransferase [Lactococcus formosensis]MDG6187898.1 acetyltransferase [Lactococcus formosensis]
MKLLVVGAGGYFKSFLDTIHPSQFEIVGLLDDRYPEIKEWFGYKVLGNVEDAEVIMKDYEVYNLFIAIGNSTIRKSVYTRLSHLKIGFPTVIDSTAVVSRKAILGQGSFIGKSTIINNDVVIGDFCVVNSGAIVEHGSRIGKNVNISPGAVINGQVTVGDNTMVGSNSVTIQTLNIGENVVIGAGTVVIKDIPQNTTVVGNPGKIIKSY